MRLDWRGVLGILLSIAFLWWALHGVPWVEVLHHLRAADPWLLAATVVVATLVVPLRAVRWRTILAPIDPKVPLGALWRGTAIGVAVNNTAPARVGEIARAFALTREWPSIPFSTSFASLAVDRIFDAVVVLLLMGLSVLDPKFPRHDAGTTARVAHTLGLGTVAAVAALAALYLLVFLPARVITLYERFARRLAPRLEARGRDALLAFAAGLGVLRNPRRFATVLWWSVVFWLGNAFAFWLGFRAFGIEVSYSAALLVQGVVVVGVSVPQGPGFFGVFEAAARWTLAQVYGVSTSLAVSWAIGFHILTFLPITLIGLYYFVGLGMHLRELSAPRASARADAPPTHPGDVAPVPDETEEPAASAPPDVASRRR